MPRGETELRRRRGLPPRLFQWAPLKTRPAVAASGVGFSVPGPFRSRSQPRRNRDIDLPMTVISKLAEFVAHADVAALPAAERVLQANHVLDALVAAAAATRTSEAKSLFALAAGGALPERIGARAATVRL